MKKLSKVLSFLFHAFCIFVFIGALVFVFLPQKVKQETFIFGYKPYIIATGSMEPKLQTKSLAIVKKGDYKNLKVGDVIAFKAYQINGNLAFHRIIEISEDGIITKGDNNSVPDNQVTTQNEYVGTMVYHTNITATILTNLKTPQGILIYIAMPLAGIVCFSIGMNLFLKNIKSTKTKMLIVLLVILIVTCIAFVLYLYIDLNRVREREKKVEEVVTQFKELDATSKLMYDTSQVMGIIAIDKIALEYPIIAYKNKDTLNKAINYYYGGSFGDKGNTVLIGHDTRSGTLFGKNNLLKKGDLIKITTMNQNTYIYRMDKSFVVDEKDTSVLEQDKSKQELTLISCTKNKRNRLVIKASLIESKK